MSQGYAAARSMGNASMGKTDDLRWSFHCWNHEKVMRWLCNCCRRTDVKSRKHPEAGIFRRCPAEQRNQGGYHAPRKVVPTTCDPAEWEQMRTRAQKLGHLLTQESFKVTGWCTWKAGVGNQFAGGTARGETAPCPGQARLATNRVVSAWRSTTAAGT